MKRTRRRRQKSTAAAHCIVYICTYTVYRVPCFYSLMTDRCHSERLIEIERELENEIIEIKAILARRKTEIETRSKLPPSHRPLPRPPPGQAIRAKPRADARRRYAVLGAAALVLRGFRFQLLLVAASVWCCFLFASSAVRRVRCSSFVRSLVLLSCSHFYM